MVEGSCFGASSSLGGCLTRYRLWEDIFGAESALGSDAGLLSEAIFVSAFACSSALTASRWPSNTVVLQPRSFTAREAQIFAAAAASLIGPATSRTCIPKPLLFSLMTMMGRSVVSAALDLDLRSPCQSARKPGIELAPPTSTPNSVCWATSSGLVADAPGAASSDAFGATATTSGI